VIERVEAEILNYSGMVWGSREHLVTFPTAQSDCANVQSASGFWLEDFQLEAPPPEMAADGVWLIWNWNSFVM
jgi:hypothetical protein